MPIHPLTNLEFESIIDRLDRLQRAVAFHDVVLEAHFPADFQRNCEHCGRKLSENDRKCRMCGKKVAA